MSGRMKHAKRSRKSYRLRWQRVKHYMTGSHAKARNNGGDM